MARTYNPEVASARSALSIHCRWHPDDLDEITRLRGEFVTVKLADLISRNLKDSPPLTAKQTARLVGLLIPDMKEA